MNVIPEPGVIDHETNSNTDPGSTKSAKIMGNSHKCLNLRFKKKIYRYFQCIGSGFGSFRPYGSESVNIKETDPNLSIICNVHTMRIWACYQGKQVDNNFSVSHRPIIKHFCISKVLRWTLYNVHKGVSASLLAWLEVRWPGRLGSRSGSAADDSTDLLVGFFLIIKNFLIL